MWLSAVARAVVEGKLDPKRSREIVYALRALKETLELTEQGAKAETMLKAFQELKALQKATA